VILPWCPNAGKEVTDSWWVRISDVDVKCYEMTFLRKSDNNGKIFVFHSKEDKYWVEEEPIVDKLQVPTTDQRNKYHFCNPITKAERCYCALQH
jgi:hypothetical protein